MTKLYFADVDRLTDPDVFEKLYRTLPKHRQEKIDRLRFEKDKRLCMGAWLLLMQALKREGVADKGTQMLYGPSGKPYLADCPEVFFNLSHSGNRVLCALSDGEVGCDVQKVTTADQKLAERYFCPEECQCIAAAAQAQNQLFFRFWTLKESFIKNIGKGLSLPLNEFCIRLTGGSPVVIQQILPEEHFYFREFDLHDGYQYACCARKADISDIQMLSIV